MSVSRTTQHSVILPTSEEECVAMVHGTKIALAIRAVLDFVQPHLSGEYTNMYEDNEGAKALAEYPQGSHRSKYIDVRLHFLWGLVGLGQVVLHSVTTTQISSRGL